MQNPVTVRVTYWVLTRCACKGVDGTCVFLSQVLQFDPAVKEDPAAAYKRKGTTIVNFEEHSERGLTLHRIGGKNTIQASSVTSHDDDVSHCNSILFSVSVVFHLSSLPRVFCFFSESNRAIGKYVAVIVIS